MIAGCLNTNTTPEKMLASCVRIRGTVQGVGFRPTVWQVARSLDLTGYVLNDGEGVLVFIQGNPEKLQQFESELRCHCPPLALIESMEFTDVSTDPELDNFSITLSENTSSNTGVSADAAICKDCLSEILDPQNRRFHYPFTNCTNCGPRFSIIQDIPYDRRNTSMASFTMCADCQAEYDNPEDRRFHAQPNACSKCGPQVWLEHGDKRVSSETAIQETARLLMDGKIVAIKGIGGFHLACDATNETAVNQLRERKRRPRKALAIMARSLAAIRHYCAVDHDEADALQSASAPIVILDTLSDCPLPVNLAPGITQLGFMLPYSPLHVVLMEQLAAPIVLTSGNLSEEPQCITNEQALNRLSGIADAFLLHDREIVNRVDDSVVRKMDGQIRTLRRARGVAPGAFALPEGFPTSDPLLAYGTELKNTFCLIQHGHAMQSQHMGDLENSGTWQDYGHNLNLYRSLYEFTEASAATDSHPDYLSSSLGRETAASSGIACFEIQHHHAHIASVMAENGFPMNCKPVIGIALDGLGYGNDGSIWGGEIFVADYRQCTRVACLKPIPLPGGALAMKQPWRNTYAHLRQSGLWQTFSENCPDSEAVKLLRQQPLKTLDNMMDRGINSPMASSCGRLFDAVAGILGFSVLAISYEGQAAMEMEAAIKPADRACAKPYPFGVTQCGPLHIDPAPMWQALLNDLKLRKNPGYMAARFHAGLAEALHAQCLRLQEQQGLNKVALGGGVFQNKTLLETLSNRLRQSGFKVYQACKFPSNDGGLALGQAMIALASTATSSTYRGQR